MKTEKQFIIRVTEHGEYYVDLKTFCPLYPKGNQVNVYIGDIQGALVYLENETPKLGDAQKWPKI
jgi:hypothetical protein